MGSEGFTWGDAWAIANAPTPGSALYLALSPESRGWSADTYVLADVVDAVLRVCYYTEAQATGKKPRKPKPYPRPGVRPASVDVQRFGYEPMTIPEMRLRLGWDKPAVESEPQAPTGPRPCCLLPAPCKHRT